ncbi:unnamed protein product, partial [Lampetra planeri]
MGDQATQGPLGTSSLRRQSGRHPQASESSGHGEASSYDLQAQLRELRRENDTLRRELDGGRDGRTGPGMNNVNFWSPDVKRDKGVRREEAVRTSVLKDHYRTNQEDTQDQSEENFFYLQSEHERQAKELLLLRKTMEEMEVRINSQKQTLGARDESIQKLLEMLQNQGESQGHLARGQRTGIITMVAQEAEAQLENMQVRE